jgi:hypothetical protein
LIQAKALDFIKSHLLLLLLLLLLPLPQRP